MSVTIEDAKLFREIDGAYIACGKVSNISETVFDIDGNRLYPAEMVKLLFDKPYEMTLDFDIEDINELYDLFYAPREKRILDMKQSIRYSQDKYQKGLPRIVYNSYNGDKIRRYEK